MPLPSKGCKDIYLARTVQELNKQIDTATSKIQTNISPGILCTSAKKLYEEAEKIRGEDEERAYVLYMRYIALATKILPANQEAKQKHSHLLPGRCIRGAIERAEELQKSLVKRYEVLRQRETSRVEDDETAKKDSTKEDEVEAKSSRVEGKALVPMRSESAVDELERSDTLGFVTSRELYDVMQNEGKTLLILDVRSSKDFQKSQIESRSCINVPAEKIKLGLVASRVQDILDRRDVSSWQKRKQMDLIVLVDWNSSPETVEKPSPILILWDALKKWDPGSRYGAALKILNGGFESWILHFPMSTSNSSFVTTENNESFVEDIISCIDYPDLDETITKVVTAKSVDALVPTVDRNSKPSRFLVTGDEMPIRKESDFWNGADLCKDMTPNKPPHYEKNMDGKMAEETRPAVHSKGLQDANAERKKEICVPLVDRASKAKAVVHYKERDKQMEFLMQTNEYAIKESIELEASMLVAEKNVQVTQKQWEETTEKNKKEQLHKNELYWLDLLKKYEEDKRKMEEENRLLRCRLEDLIASPESSEIKQSEKEKEREVLERLRNKDQEKLRLEALVADLRRKRKEKIEREKERLGKTKKETCESDEWEPNRSSDGARSGEDALSAGVRDMSLAKSDKCDDRGVRIVKLKDEQVSGSSTNLKRFHSSPNLAQMLEEEDASVKSRIPQFDRKIKPLSKPHPNEVYAARQRNFQPVWGQVDRALTGLRNLGNTCYMNSIVQCISNTTALAHYFVTGHYRDDVNVASKTRGEIAEEVAAAVRELWKGQYRSISLRDLKHSVGKYHKSFLASEQQDSHEFLTYVMNWLHDDLNKEKAALCHKEQNNDGLPQEEAGRAAWDEFKKSNDSMIVSLFWGQQRSVVKCLTCDKESVTFEPFSTMSVPIPSSSRCTLKECIQHYLREESISGWNCPACKAPRDAIKKIDLWKLPQILVIHLQRFLHDGLWRKKPTMVDFQVVDFDMRTYLTGPSEKSSNYNYQLYAVSNHYGSMEGGHYTSCCKNSVYRKWYKFDDQEVYAVRDSETVTSAAYILFYSAVEKTVPEVI